MMAFRSLVVLALFCLARPLFACPFCGTGGQTLATEVSQANLIVFGTLSNAKRDPNEFGKGTTDMKVDIVVKDKDNYLNGKNAITLPKYVPPDPKNPSKFLVFCEVFKGNLDPYRGEAVAPDSKIAEYLKGAISVRDKDAGARLMYFFNYLDSPELTIALDAQTEFANADYKEFLAVAPKFPAKTVAKWLKDPNTPPSRYSLYASMLGHCGKGKEDIAIIREMLDDPKKRSSTGLDGILAGYILLDPKAGWDYVLEIVKDEKQEFLTRYAALRTIRFFWDYRTDIITKDQAISAIVHLLDQSDIADLPMDDLRRWQRFEVTNKVLALYDQKSHNIPIVKRAIIRFALCAAPTSAEAATFVKRMRAEEPERVKDIENLLELEKQPTTPPKPAVTTPPKLQNSVTKP
jgi:hypothetical protein